MKLIIGLGNPGEKYISTRHNVGFIVLDKFLEDLESLKKTFWETDKNSKCLIKKIKKGNDDILLAKPQVFMNNSGEAVSKLSSYYKIEPQDIYIIHDDLDLPLGKIRIRMGGAAGGHRGVESIIAALKTDKFLRIRLGIGHPHRRGVSQRDKSTLAVDEYVLARFTPTEKSKVRTMTNQALKSLRLILEHGIDLYMSKYNGGNRKSKKSNVKSTSKISKI